MTDLRNERMYYAAKGAPFKDEDAQVLGEEFDKIGEATELTPQSILEEAQCSASPIHEYFEWDDKVAAKKWRKRQAYYYLCNIKIELVSTGEIVHAFHSVKITKDKPSAFKRIDVIALNNAWLGQIIERAYGELAGWQKRYRQYSSISGELGQVLDGPVQEAIDLLRELPVEA